MSADADSAEPGDHGERRRDFLLLVAGAVGGVAAVSALWPLIDSLNPSADIVAAGAPVDFDFSGIRPADQKIVAWRGRPVFVLRRLAEELQMLQSQRDTSLLRDPDSTAHQQPPYAQTGIGRSSRSTSLWSASAHISAAFPDLEAAVGGSFGTNWPRGYFCPCHGAGRVFTGVPTPYNLPVPPYRFVSKTVVRIGENPLGANFDFSSIEQV
jgi:ubiquinol-cytochrome c reductase iron-sulfur subunit